MRSEMRFAGLVLAAGKGSRFVSESGEPFPKVLRHVLGRPMVLYALDAMRGADVHEITLIIGFAADEVRREVGESVSYVLQTEQRGSGHAVACARDAFCGFEGGLVIMCGDSPLFTADTVRAIRDEHARSGAAVTLASAVLDDPFGYGRIVRGSDGAIQTIVEEKCASDAEKSIREVNGGAYAFDAPWLFGNIDKMALNEANEYNLTDMVRVAIEQGRKIATVSCDSRELLGVNTPDQLRAVEEILQNRA